MIARAATLLHNSSEDSPVAEARPANGRFSIRVLQFCPVTVGNPILKDVPISSGGGLQKA